MWSTWLLKSATDLRQRWLQAAVLAVVLMAGTAALTLAFTVDRSTRAVFEQVHSQANGPDVWLSGEEAELGAAAARPEVDETSEVFHSIEVSLIFAGETHAALAWGVGEAPDVSPGLLREGRWVDPARDDEVVIDIGLARAASIEPGDRLSIVTPNARAASYEVVGIATPTVRVPYPQLTPGGVWVSKAALEGLAGAPFGALGEAERAALKHETSLGVRLTGDTTPAQFAGSVPATLRPVTWQDTRAAVVDQTRGPSTMLRIFSIFAVLALGFVVAATITNHALAQKREIGLLKATGITPRGTTLMFLGQMLAISVPAALLGIAVGVATTRLFQWSITDLLGADPATSASLPGLVAVFFAVQVLVALCAVLPAMRAGRIRIVDAIASSPRQSAAGASLVARAANALRLPMTVVLGLKDVFSRPLRSWLTVAAVSVAVATLMMTVTLRYSLQLVVEEPALMGSSPYELQAARLGQLAAARSGDDALPADTLTHDQAEAAIAAHPGVEAFITDRATTGTIDGIDVVQHAVDGDVSAMKFLMLEGRAFSGTGEVMVAAGLARTLGLAAGGQIPVEAVPGQSVRLTIVGIYFVDANDGNELMYALAELRAFEPATEPGGFAIRLKPGVEPDAVIADLAGATGGRLALTDLTRETDANISDGQQLIAPMTLLGGGLALLAAANLLSSLVFSVRERTAEFGVMKSIGLTPRQVVGVVMTGVAPLALLGTVIGVPVGYFLIEWIFSSQAEAHQPSDIIQRPPSYWLVGLVVVALITVFVGAFWPARRAGRLGVAEALRAE